MSSVGNIINNLKDPRKKSITQLVIYGIFFAFVFIIFGVANSTSDNYDINDNLSENDNSIEGYNYKIIFNNFDIVEGSYLNNKSVFRYNSDNYYLEDGLIYFIDNINNSYYLRNINYKLNKILEINKLLDTIEAEFVTTYKDGSEKFNYVVSGTLFNEYYYELNEENDISINIDVMKVQDVIQYININFNDYSQELKNIVIEYSNINNIQSLDFDKQNYTYKE